MAGPQFLGRSPGSVTQSLLVTMQKFCILSKAKSCINAGLCCTSFFPAGFNISRQA